MRLSYMNNLKSILWTIVGIGIFIAIIRFFIYLLPFIIVAGLVAYIIFKGKMAFAKKKYKNEAYNSYNQSQNQNVYEKMYMFYTRRGCSRRVRVGGRRVGAVIAALPPPPVETEAPCPAEQPLLLPSSLWTWSAGPKQRRSSAAGESRD